MFLIEDAHAQSFKSIKMKKTAFIFSLFISIFNKSDAQNTHLGFTIGTTYMKTEKVDETLLGTSGLSNYIPYRPRLGGQIGVSLNRPIYKVLSIEFETGYALSGYRLKTIPPNSSGFPTSANENKLFDYHQIYFALSPKVTFKKNWGLTAGIVNVQNISPSNMITPKTNWAYKIGAFYHIKKWDIGVESLNYLTPYIRFTNYSYQWRAVSLNAHYTFKSF